MGTPIDVVGNSRNWDMIPYDVQLIGGIGLHTGHIAEMMTGEGKTLVAVMPLYLNALSGKNCQLVTVNDYLALRDSMWVGAVLRWLGLTVGCIQNGQSPEERRNMYACDVTYGTNSEFGFDYLRDMGMANSKDELVQRDYYFCIIDEIDSILIDEARTPLIISGPVDVSTHKYDHYKPKVEKLYKQQLQLCNRLANQSKDIVMGEKDANDDEFEDAITDMFLVKLGMPKHKVFMRLMQEPHFRKIMDKKEQEAHSEQNRGMLQGLKDRLFFTIDERHNDADLSELGRQTISPNDPEHFVIPDLSTGMHKIDNDSSLSEDEKIAKREELQEYFEESTEVIHNISQLLKAYCLYEKDYHYIVQENKAIIVDEHTGRPMPGRRFSDGLHQALEAKEGVDIEKESQTLATVTIQNYFRMYDKLAGMTGTATTEKNEFKERYNSSLKSITFIVLKTLFII